MKTNTQNESVEAILESNSTGVGKTNKLPEIYKLGSDNVFQVAGYDPVQLSENIIKAKFIQYFNQENKGVNDLNPYLEALASDFLGTFHAKAANKEKPNPMTNPKRVLSAEEYRKNYLRINASHINIDTIEVLLAKVDSITEKSTKQNLADLLADFSELFETAENKHHYMEILAIEEKDKLRFDGLTAAGFRDIKRANNSIVATVSLADAANAGAALLANEFALLRTDADLEAGLITLEFKEIEE